MKKAFVILLTMAAALFISCESTKVNDKDPAVGKGVNAWNMGRPDAATAYWTEIKEPAKQKKYLNYVKLYNDGKAALDSTDGVKASNEAKYLSACNTALTKFGALDPNLKIPANVNAKGATLTAARVENLLAAQKVNDAIKMYNSAVKVYGQHKAFEKVAKEVEVNKQILAKRNALMAQADKANEIEGFDQKVAAYDAVLAKCPSEEAAVADIAKKSGYGDEPAVSVNVRAFKKVRQDIAIQREGAFRDRVYEYKDKIGEEFARQPSGKGSGKDGSFTLEEVLAHYKEVEKNMDKIYQELLDFAAAHQQDVGQDIIDDVKSQKKDLNNKIAQVNREIANKKEVESRGKVVMPLMIGLFNPVPGTKGNDKKSRPAKFSATGVKGNEYWWGMVSIPKGQMNDLVITLKDNRTVRVFNQNTKSGKRIEKDGLQDLVSRSSRVGNSWPVLNAGSQLNGSNYYFEIQKGKTDSYSGEVVVYSSFVTRMR